MRIEHMADLVKSTSNGLQSVELIETNGFVFQLTRNVGGITYAPSLTTNILPFLSEIGDDEAVVEVYSTLKSISTSMCFMYVDQDENNLRLLLNKDVMVTIKRRNNVDFTLLIQNAIELAKNTGGTAIAVGNNFTVYASPYVDHVGHDWKVKVQYADLMTKELTKADVKIITTVVTHANGGVDPVELRYDLEQRCLIMDNGIGLAIRTTKDRTKK